MSFWCKKGDCVFETMDTEYFLKNILKTQEEILDTLKKIDKNIFRYLGTENDKKFEELNEVVRKGHFKESQREALKELIKLSSEIPKDIIEQRLN